jgi:3-deoxy-D-manno-octulosonate 8-phosphate phosphatase KdsC-like HAD superfamily phosphatase
LQQAGLRVGILSGRRSPAVRLRAKELGMDPGDISTLEE